MFYGRYLKVEFPEINKSYTSDYDFDEKGGNAPRMKVEANLKKGFYIQGKISLYNLNNNSIKELQSNEYSVIINAGYKIGSKQTQIVYAEKRYTELLRIGSDLIFNIYFLSGILNKKEAITIRKDNINNIIRNQCRQFGYSFVFKDNVFNNSTLENITLTGNLFNRLQKLQSYLSFDFYEQNKQLIFTPLGKDGDDGDVFEIDVSEGLLSIPTYSRVGIEVNFKMMFNINVFIGRKIRLTNKFQRINVSDENKTFASEIIEQNISQIKDIVFRVIDINYNLDTRGKDFNIEIQAQKNDKQ